MDGVLVLDKPAGWTSHDAVNKVRRLAGTRKVGHLGTLDPMATGVLPLVLGRATRLAQFLSPGLKLYEGVIRFGWSTDTYDREGTATSEPKPVRLDPAEAARWLEGYRGRIQQIPPAVSAKKIAGRPAHELARRNLPVDLAAIEVEITGIELLECGEDTLRLRIECTPGTYVRTLAHDLGRDSGCGAHLDSLRRLRSSGFVLDQARTLPQLIELSERSQFAEAVLPMNALLPEWPAEHVDAETELHIRQGRDFRVSPFRGTASARQIKAIGPAGDLIAIAEARMPFVYHPTVVL